jgi:tetratricopeptide (TPR) repeat protein
MKKIVLFALAAVLSFSACNVEVQNPNALTAESFWKTETDAQYGIDAVYNMFYKPDTYSRWLWFRLDLTSDEGFSISPWAELAEWTKFRYNNYNFAEGNVGSYNACYRAIFRANQVLAYVPGIEFKDETKKNQILAQAYFLRGLYYYNLALLWGSSTNSLAIVLEPSTPGMQPEGHNGTEIYEQAISDYTEALKNLPDSWDAANLGRATKGAAYALRAKAYMQMHRWSEAKSDLDVIVNSGRYDLVPNYLDNFTADNENNKESVFEIQFSAVNPASQSDGDFALNPLLGLNRGQFFGPPGKGWTDGELRAWLVDEFKKEKDLSGNFDIRLKYSCIYEGMSADFTDNQTIFGLDVSSADRWAQQNWKGRVFFRKYARVWLNQDDYANPINVRWIRYADVLLMQAECIAEIGGDLAAAVANVDKVRARVNMPGLAVNHPEATTNADAFLKRLQMERVTELATEGHRWEDLKRWGLLDTQTGLDEVKARDDDFSNFQIGKHNVLPIPSNEKNNNPNIEQNPNY